MKLSARQLTCETMTHCVTVYTYTQPQSGTHRERYRRHQCLLMPVTIANEGVPSVLPCAAETDYVTRAGMSASNVGGLNESTCQLICTRKIKNRAGSFI